jgi:hypothetical protein
MEPASFEPMEPASFEPMEPTPADILRDQLLQKDFEENRQRLLTTLEELGFKRISSPYLSMDLYFFNESSRTYCKLPFKSTQVEKITEKERVDLETHNQSLRGSNTVCQIM